MSKKYFGFKKLSSPLSLVLVLFILLAIPVTVYTVLKSEENTKDPNASIRPVGFQESEFAVGLSRPTVMEFTPDNRLFIAQQSGQIRVVKNGALLPSSFLTLSVDDYNERGLIGLTLDPNYATNRFVYVYYTVPSSGGAAPFNRVSRFTANSTNPDVVQSGSETILLELNSLGAGNHNGGALHFGNDGKLYIAVGENAITSNSQTVANLHGKLLRINPVPDNTATTTVDERIPSDNPTSFVNTSGATITPTGVNRAIWAIGFRNPFTFAVDPVTGKIYVNDVGAGSREEINELQKGKNYGWPTCEGSCNNVNATNPIYHYPRSDGTAITGGVFYRGNTFPSDYSGDYFFGDYSFNWIKRLDQSSLTVNDFATSAGSPVDLKIGSDGALYHLSYGAGKVYRIQYDSTPEPPATNVWCEAEVANVVAPMIKTTGDTSASGGGYIYTTVLDVTNVPPVGTGQATLGFSVPIAGTYTFWARLFYSNGESNSYWIQVNDGDFYKLGNEDDFNNWHWVNWQEGSTSLPIRVSLPAGNNTLKIFGREANTRMDKILFTSSNNYQPTNQGDSANCGTPSQGVPTANITTPAEGTLYNYGQTIDFSATATDPEDGTLPASAFTWEVRFHHDTHWHPHTAPVTGSKTGSFVTNFSEPADNVWYRIVLKVKDSAGQETTIFRDVLPRKSSITLNTNPTGLQLNLDGVVISTPTTFNGVVSFPRILEALSPQSLTGKNYQFTSWSNGGSRVQTINTQATNTTYTATFSEIPSTLPSPWVTQDIGAVGLAGSASHSIGTFTVAGSGDDIWNSADAFRFVYQDLTGDGVITAKVNSQTNTDPWAKSGVMIREDLGVGSKHAFMLVTPTNGLAFQYRTTTNGGSFGVETTGNVPTWVRFQRVGNTLTGFRSADGVSWTNVGSTTISMASTVKVGLAVTSHNNTALSTAAFANVTVSNTTPVPGDASGDGSVGVADLNILINSWASTTDLRADFNKDNKINLGDLTILINNWGR